MLSMVPATMMSMSAISNSERKGLMTNSPLTRATRTSDIGPSKGTSDTAMAALAAKPAKLSGSTSLSALINWIMTCVPAW